MRTPILSFRDVSFGYHVGHPVLEGVNFEMRPGRIAAVLGPNGAGKTTLLYLALGWLTPWRGEIRFAGIRLSDLSSRTRGRHMALVPQSEYTPFDYSALEYALLGRTPHLSPLEMPSEEDVDIALHAMEQVGIAHLARNPVPTLSGGERQLLLIARALAQIATPPSPTTSEALLLLDEPTAHLDLRNKVRIIEIMRRLRDAGVSILMTNHEPDVVLAVADDVLLIEPGHPPQFGPLQEVFTAEALSRVYGIPLRLLQTDGHRHVVWT